MQCPSCKTNNRPDASFCEQCGTKLELVCPACKAAVGPGRDSAKNVATPTTYREFDLKRNHFRLRVDPEIAAALDMNLVAFGSDSFAESVEIEGVLTDARSGDAVLFARKTM